MRINDLSRVSVPFALTLLVSACGGGGSGDTVLPLGNTDSSDNIEQPIGAANQTEPAVTVSGRVADGYIRGATVCVDINKNDACDADEPFAITVEGGAYDLAVPAAHTDKPIVAAIPAAAIDEDTGEAVGQPLVFIAPADRPEFLSPITTLVHQEQRANPALNSEEAEQAVKSMLGIDEANVSLFSDYVAQSDASENTNGTAQRFEYLHDTARVVASMMKDIENQVENAAVSRGVDVAGDSNTRRAIQDIVRNEVRQLLPQIARQVAEIVGNSDSSTEAGSESQGSVFDPQALALSLRPDVEDENLTGRIQANINRVDVVESDLRSLLSDGVYWMEFNCHYDVQDKDSSIAQSENTDTGVSMFPMPECEAMYGRVQLTDDGAELASESYVFNIVAGTWESPEYEDDNRYADYSLVDGEWTIVESEGPDGQVEFLTENSAVVTNDEGAMHLKSVTQALDGSPVIHHLLEDGADPIWFDIIGNADIFPSESRAYRISVSQTYHPYVMFNFASYDADVDYCVDYNSNCNVVEIVTNEQASTAVSLNQLRDSTVEGVNLRSPSRFDDRSLMRLHGVARADGELPNQGSVVWILEGDTHPTDYALPVGIDPIDNEHVDSEYVDNSLVEITPEDIGSPSAAQPEPWKFASHEECVAVLIEKVDSSDVRTDVPEDFFAPGDFSGTRADLVAFLAEQENVNLDVLIPVDGFDGLISHFQQGDDVDETCSLIVSQTALENTMQSDDPLETDDEGTIAEDRVLANLNGALLSGRWKLIEVDNVEMIEIYLPITLRTDSEGESEEAMLLIEYDGFVRAGARLPDTRIDRVFTYNDNAFETLRSIVENGMDQNQ